MQGKAGGDVSHHPSCRPSDRDLVWHCSQCGENEPAIICEPDTPLNRLIIDTAEEMSVTNLALGFLRYEAMRKLSPNALAELNKRNIRGEWFDDMIDQLVLDNSER